MYFKQFYLGCLAQASYLVGSDGEAAVVDPRRDIDEYLEEAARQGLTIRHVIETHLHADFVSGHRELAARTGARIYFGARAGAAFEHVGVREGDEIRMGQVGLRFLETPGHTPESISILVLDRHRSEEPWAVLTGDTLFVGDVGRPDLLGEKCSAEDLAGMLYDSLHGKLLRLPDSVLVYPGHGAGSLCGKNISNETSSTIGQQRRFNYALQPMPRDEFVRMMTTDLPEAPSYFPRDVALNRAGAAPLEALPQLRGLSPGEVERTIAAGGLLLDARSAAAFGTAHLPGATNIGLSGQFASWAGTLLPPSAALVIVTESPEEARQAQVRLARVGMENVAGFLDGGVAAWQSAGRPLVSTEQIAVDELKDRIADGRVGQLVDVRRPAEWNAGHIAGAVSIPLHQIVSRAEELDRSRPVTVICASGYRSSIATSLLQGLGFVREVNVAGGMNAWTAVAAGSRSATGAGSSKDRDFRAGIPQKL